MNAWQWVFLQSRANNGFYDGDVPRITGNGRRERGFKHAWSIYAITSSVDRATTRSDTSGAQMKCERCISDREALYLIRTDSLKLRVCKPCAEEARRLGLPVKPFEQRRLTQAHLKRDAAGRRVKGRLKFPYNFLAHQRI